MREIGENLLFFVLSGAAVCLGLVGVVGGVVGIIPATPALSGTLFV